MESGIFRVAGGAGKKLTGADGFFDARRGPVGLAFFEEGADAFLEIGVGAGIDAGADGGFNVVGKMVIGEFAKEAFGGFHSGGTVADEASGRGHGLRA